MDLQGLSTTQLEYQTHCNQKKAKYLSNVIAATVDKNDNLDRET